MKFTINATDFRDALKAACEVAPAKGILPEQSCLYIHAEDEKITVQARSESAEITLTVPCIDVQDDGDALVPSRMLLDYVSLASGEVSVSTDSKQRMTIKNGKKTSVLSGMETDKFKPITFSGKPLLSTSGQELAACINRTSFCTSTDETRSQLCGVHLSIAPDGGIRYTGMDGVRVSICDMDKTDMLDESESGWEMTFPNATLKLIASQFGDADTVTLSLDNYRACLTRSDRKMIFPLNVKQYLDLNRIINQTYKTELLMDAKAFLEALRLTEIAAGAAAANDSRWNIVRLQTHGQNGCISLSADNASTEAATTVDCDQHGEDITIFFNVRYIKDLAAACARESDQITFSFTSPVGIASIKPVNAPCNMATYVVPVRTNLS